MTATFTCPKCGRHGSIKKEIPRAHGAVQGLSNSHNR